MKSRCSIVIGFLALMAIGAILLSSPFARNAGCWGDLRDAAFMSCSAVCITGLSVVDVAAEYNTAGLIVLVLLVEVGSIGLVTLGTFLLLAIGRRLSLAREFRLMDAYGVPAIRGLRGLIVSVVASMLFFQLAGAGLLYWRTHDLFGAVFFSAMGFCNAGFSIKPDSLACFADDAIFTLTMAALVVAGGIGFLVIYNLFTYRILRRDSHARGRLSLQSRVTLRFTCYLIALMFALFLLCEWNGSLADFPLAKKFSVGLFQAVTPRTCGFSIVPTESLRQITRLFYQFMMFIGGAPGSVAGGLKVTTLAVLLATLFAMCRGESETVIDRRTISMEIVRESIVIAIAMVSLVAAVVGVLYVTESTRSIPSDALVFEAISAITTTGLSVGDTTAKLSHSGRIAIMCAMFLGRLGALTVVMMIGDRESKRHVRYPNEELVVG